MHRIFHAAALALAVLPANNVSASDGTLSLSEAVRIAVTAKDPSLLRFDRQAAALADRAVADAQLPDPTLRGALANFPTDTFRFDQENMTQIQAGLRQQFPAGRTLALTGERRRAEANVARARKDLALREIELAVRRAWFDFFFRAKAQSYVRESRSAVGELVDALNASFAAGKLNSQDILRAELELSLLDDRLTELKRGEDSARADLARFVGAAISKQLPQTLPDLPAPPGFDAMQAMLVQHPAALVADAEIIVGDKGIELAEQAYKPSWALDGGYGHRGGARADFASVGVTLSIPLFAHKRQDRRLSAAVNERGVAQMDRAAKLLDLRQGLERAYVDWSRLGERIDLYGDAIIERANETAAASISTYANGRTDFPELIRSQLAQLNAVLKRLELRTERAKAWAMLTYFAGNIQ